MAPPMRYLTSDLAHAIRVSRSMKQAASLIGMSLGALRKRALVDPYLKPMAMACIERGKRSSGHRFARRGLK